MILHKNGVFCLKTDAYSYLFRIGKHGQPEHLHFGRPVDIDDGNALGLLPGLGWGSSILYHEDGFCLDSVALEWSGTARGDYRESPLQWTIDDVSCPSDFVYSGFIIHEGDVLMKQGLPQARGAESTLIITMKDPSGCTLELIYALFPTAITRRVVLYNSSGQKITVRKLMSFSADIAGSWEMTTFDGGWISEMNPSKTFVGAAPVTHKSTTGFSSNQHHPGFILSQRGATESWGAVLGINLIYSGNHYASCARSHQGLTRVMQGIGCDDFCWELNPGDFFETPEAVLCWSDKGFNAMSERMHQFVTDHVIPAYWRNRERPILYNSWEGCMFDFNRSRLLDLASRAQKLGCELFVLDDGWFGKRNNDSAGLGDYTVNKRKLPGGLKALCDRINALGMEFGLWFEPEAVNPDSDLYRTHPEWILKDGYEPLLGRNEYLLDLTKTEVRDYIVHHVGTILDSVNISYVKWDMNRHSTALGERAHRYILGLYNILDRIFTPRPHILLESCASGGNRFDLGMLCYGPQIWCSDDTDPIERLTIQHSLSYLYPQSCFGAHISASPHAQTLRNTPLSTRGNVSFFGVLGYELDLKHLVSVEEKEISQQIQFYKKYRRVFQFGRFTRLFSEEAKAWQISLKNVSIVGVFHSLISAAPGYQWLYPQGLQEGRLYSMSSRPQLLRVGQFGGLVKHITPVELNPNGLILRTADRLYPMMDGVQSVKASGAAFMSGIPLNPRFSGTGYDKDSRNQGDFSSNIYVIEEV